MGGYSYSVTDEQIREFKRIPVQERLQWLEDLNDFTERALTKERKLIREKFRRGEI